MHSSCLNAGERNAISQKPAGKRLLVLSVSAGSGHVRAAEAICAQARAHFPNLSVRHRDLMQLMPMPFRKMYTDFYLKLASGLPEAWGWLYRKTDREPTGSLSGRVRRSIQRLCAHKLFDEIQSYAPDAIICTHFLPAELLADASLQKRLHCPLWVVVTDFDLHQLWIHSGVTGCRQHGLAQAEAKEREKDREKADREKALDKQRELAAKSRPAEKAAEKSPERTEKPAASHASRPEPEPERPLSTPPDGNAFAGLKGKLKMPVKGELLASFGARRADGPSWKGLFIKASEGSEVKAVAAGEVIFADWRRGFGNLLIVDHGGQYMTIYGNNQSLLKRPGDKLKAGDIIATVGNSGGNEQSGLYFEMRHQGRALDPAAWINR